jgi:zinc-binding alcohol dehydrogenase/oxidoreductase
MRTMKAVVLREIGSLDKMIAEEVEYPSAKPGEAVVRIKAAALNHRDWWIVQGLYAKIRVPIILGSDGVGVVQSVGDSKDEAWIGQTVVIHPSLNWGDQPKAQGKDYKIFGMPDNGTHAEYTLVPVGNLFKKPDHVTDEEAAAMPLAGLTAYRALFRQGGLTRDDNVLITGIGGGVATLAMQMALAIGARVIVTSGSDEKIRLAVKAGAKAGANYRTAEWSRNIQTESQEFGGIGLVIDGAGGSGFNELLSIINPGGCVVSYGATAGNPETIDLRKIFWKQVTLQGSTMGDQDDFKNMLALFERFQIKPIVDQVFALEQYKSAYHRMMHAEQFGKIILRA